MIRKFDTDILSARGTQIHATVIESGAEKCGLVILVHGFCAERTEGGRLTEVGMALAENGINSICCDFPGCGASDEPFDHYSMTSCLQDMESEFAYMKQHYQIDENREAMIGYSMGGRLTCSWIAKHPEFRTIGLWAAATFNAFDQADNFNGGNLNEMVKEANENGYANCYNAFDGTYLHLSKQFFDDMFSAMPLENLAEYEGNVILCHGTADTTVWPAKSEIAYQTAVKANDRKLVVIDGANHGFGLWDNHMEQSAVLTSSTIEFFRRHLAC